MERPTTGKVNTGKQQADAWFWVIEIYTIGLGVRRRGGGGGGGGGSNTLFMPAVCPWRVEVGVPASLQLGEGARGGGGR